jgi:predicted nucleic acid-binding protein
MIYKHLFIDSDVLLDMLLTREPFWGYTQLLLLESQNQGIALSTSVLVIANVNYILAKKMGASATKNTIKALVKRINILSFESDIIDLVLTGEFNDFEDGIQYLIAKRYKCDAIITRNIKDYKQSTIPVLTAEQFLRTL